MSVFGFCCGLSFSLPSSTTRQPKPYLPLSPLRSRFPIRFLSSSVLFPAFLLGIYVEVYDLSSGGFNSSNFSVCLVLLFRLRFRVPVLPTGRVLIPFFFPFEVYNISVAPLSPSSRPLHSITTRPDPSSLSLEGYHSVLFCSDPTTFSSRHFSFRTHAYIVDSHVS